MVKEYKYLTPEQVTQFVEKGWVQIENAVKPECLDLFTQDAWIRLGMDPNDKSTWTRSPIHMPRHREILTREFAPKAWGALCEILGGEERIDTTLFESCGDSLIVNLGKNNGPTEDIAPDMLGNWHIDGDWFTHFLDSGEQACTVIVLFNDIIPRAGGTFLAPEGITHVAKYLYDHPEGSTDGGGKDESGAFNICGIHDCKEFVECTGKRGDIVIFHPFMPHSASPNYLRIPRFITNPPVTLKEPLNYNRSNPDDHSLTELCVLKRLGVDSLPDWHITSKRRRFTPYTRAGKDAMIIAEVQRMKEHALKTGGVVDSMHVNGPVAYQTVIPTEG